MRVFKVPEALAAKYHGTGFALAAITGGQLIDIKYLADVFPDRDIQHHELPKILNDEALGPTVRELHALGEVSVGMLSSWEFCEL